MNGRWFDERQLEAYIADGSEKFKKSDEKKAHLEDENENKNANANANEGGGAEGERLDKFGEWLEEEKRGNEKEGRQEE